MVKVKTIAIWAIIGLVFYFPLFLIFNSIEDSICKGDFCDKIFSIISNTIFPLAKSAIAGSPEGGLVLFMLLPVAGLLMGALIGFLISAKKDVFVNKKLVWKNWQFFVSALILLFFLQLMIISIFTPVAGATDSIGGSKLTRYLCAIQGGSYYEEKYCSDLDELYPETPIDQLPNDTLFYCETPYSEYADRFVTRDKLELGVCMWDSNQEEQVKIPCCVYVDGEGNKQYLLPFFAEEGRYSVTDGKIYVESGSSGRVYCGDVGKIRYRGYCR